MASSTTSLVMRYAGGMDKKPNIPYAVPKASSDPLPEISTFLEPFAPLFRRSQSRHSLARYITGLLTDLDRKNCDTIACALAGTSTERLQHLLSDADGTPLSSMALASDPWVREVREVACWS